MTALGCLFMIVSCGTVTGLTIFCYVRLLSARAPSADDAASKP